MVVDSERPQMTATARQYVFRSVEQRTFKACRTCRQQKARCHGSENPPCRRCKAAGRDCIFDVLGAKRRRRTSDRGDTERLGNHRWEAERVATGNGMARLATPCDSQEELANTAVQGDVQTQPMPSVTGNEQQGKLRESDTQPHPWPQELTESRDEGNVLQTFPTPEEGSHREDLDLLRLNAPITAVHAMRPSCPSIDLSSPQSHRIQTQSQGSTSPAFQISVDEPNPNNSIFDDVVSAGLLSESKARELFHLYMAGANVFLPLFDTTTDTFEAIRERSSFCLCAILTVALQIDHTMPDSDVVLRKCWTESQALASRTLFSSSSMVEDIQAMLVMAAYAEKNWFAVSHALEMAEDMGLPHCLPQLLGKSTPVNGVSSALSNKKALTRMARVFLVLHNVEREVASGIARQSRLKPLNEQSLRAFLECKHSVIYDIRIVSTTEIIQLRERLLHEVDALQTLVGMVDNKLRKFHKEIEKWFSCWDKEYEEHEMNAASFHRASLRLQRDYALIILTSAMISKLGKEPGVGDVRLRMGDEMSRLIDITMETSIQLLVFMSQSDSYKWHLRWAPTYSALFAVFAAALVFKLSVLRPPVSNWSYLLSALSRIADVLDVRYPKYAQILRELSQISLCHSSSTFPNGMGSNRVHSISDTSASGGVLNHSIVSEGRSPSIIPTDSLPSYPQQPLHVDLSSSNQAPESQFMQMRPDFMLDYNSFAASLAAYENGCADIFDYAPLSGHPGDDNLPGTG